MCSLLEGHSGKSRASGMLRLRARLLVSTGLDSLAKLIPVGYGRRHVRLSVSAARGAGNRIYPWVKITILFALPGTIVYFAVPCVPTTKYSGK